MNLWRTGGRAAAALSLTLAMIGMAAPADAQTPGDVLHDAVQKMQSSNPMPGAIAILRDGDQTWHASAGQSDMFMHVPADPQMQFRIGSNTKLFTSVVLLQLEAEGKLSLDDTVDKWLPGLVNANGNDGTKIAVRQLLNHTSLLPDYMNDPGISAEFFSDVLPDKQYDPAQLVKLDTAQKQLGTPTYSNTNYILAGMIIQKITGNDVGTEIRNRIIDKLGLTHTTFPTTSPLQGNWMHGYETVRDVSFSDPTLFQGAGAIVSTLDDQAVFQRAVLSGQLLPPEQMRELQTPGGLTGEFKSYGLGLMTVDTAKCGEAYGHTGIVLGYLSLWFSSADGKRQVMVATNENSGTTFDQNTNFAAFNKAAVDAYCATGQ